MAVRFRARHNHQLGLLYFASRAPTDVFGLLELEDGREFRVEAQAFTANRTQQIVRGDLIQGRDGIVQAAYMGIDAGGVARGEFYVQLALLNKRPRVPLIRGYMGGDSDNLPLGFHEPSLSGRGILGWVQEANDVAGNVVTTINLAGTNVRRLIRAVIVKYHQVGGAAVTITVTLRDLATAVGPTHWSIASDTWTSPDLVLGANEEGLMHIGKDGFLATNDAGVLAYADNTTAPHPFPLWVDEADSVDLRIAAAAGAAGDDYDVWVQYEEWFDV